MKAILFDSWGTLIENGCFPSPVKQVKDIMNVDLPFSRFITTFESSFMTKRFESLPEGFRHACRDLGVKPAGHIIDRLVGLWNKNMLLAKPFPETVEVLEKLKKKYKIILISNTDCFGLEPVIDKFDLRRYFDAIVLSCDTGMLKTDTRMYELAIEKVGCSKSDVLMVGDSMETDIMGANRAGIKAILVDRLGKREFKDKIANLSELDKYLG